MNGRQRTARGLCPGVEDSSSGFLPAVERATMRGGPEKEERMAIADVVNGKTEPLSIRGLVGARDATPGDVLDMAARHGARRVDLKFTDLPGTWQHMGMALRSLDEDAFTEGIGFDGSSIRGFQEIYESDMLLMPDPSTAILDPFYEAPTISIVCTVLDPITREPYSRDPRYVAMKAEEHLRASGVADVCYFGPEAEFYVFDHVAFDQQAHTAFYEVDSEEGHWTSGQGFQRRGEGLSALGYTNRSQEGYFPAPPNDTLSDLRATTTRSAAPARARSTCASSRCWRWRTPCSCTSTSSRTRPSRRARRRRSCPSRSSRRTAQACTSTSRCGRTAR